MFTKTETKMSTTKWLQAVEEELCKGIVSCECLRELLSMIPTKEVNLLKLRLLKETEEEILEGDILKTGDYYDNIN